MLDAWERDSDDDESDDGFVVDTLPAARAGRSQHQRRTRRPAPTRSAVPEDGFVIDTAPPAGPPAGAGRRRRPGGRIDTAARITPAPAPAAPRPSSAARGISKTARGERLPVLFTWDVPLRAELFPEARAARLFLFFAGLLFPRRVVRL